MACACRGFLYHVWSTAWTSRDAVAVLEATTAMHEKVCSIAAAGMIYCTYTSDEALVAL